MEEGADRWDARGDGRTVGARFERGDAVVEDSAGDGAEGGGPIAGCVAALGVEGFGDVAPDVSVAAVGAVVLDRPPRK